MASRAATIGLASPEDQSVTFVELFFDLVFVFSITQIVGILHDGITPLAIGQALLVFWLVWWAWTQFTWALNAANTDHAHVQLPTLVATAVAFFMAVEVPAAFGDGAIWFAGPYVAVRALGLWIYGRVAAEDEAQHRAVRTFAFVSVGGLGAVLLGAFAGGTTQYMFWGFAILLDVIAAGVGGASEDWNLHPAHFVERHGLIVIIALGECLIVAAGGLTGAVRTADVVLLGVLAVGVSCALWWSYFPYLRPELEEGLERASRSHQAAMARDAFSLAHFPMLCGVIAFAVAVEEAVAHPADPLPLEGRLALGIGLILFVGGAAMAQLRATGHLARLRLVAIVATGAAIVGLGTLPPSASLAVAFMGLSIVVYLEHRTSDFQFD